MRILAFADIHEEEAALESLKKIAPDYDCVFICGDISQSDYFAESVLSAFKKSFVIPGNWDSERVNRLLSSSGSWIHGKRAELGNGLNVVGFGFSNPTPFGTFGELSEEEIYSRMYKLDIDGKTLLMLHCPPKGYFDEVPGANAGSESILRIIREKKPFAAFFGHIHEHAGVKKLGRTTLVKLPPAEAMRASSLTVVDNKISVEFISL